MNRSANSPTSPRVPDDAPHSLLPLSSRQKVEAIFAAALELPAPEREGVVAAACNGDMELMGEVGELLRAHGEAGNFLTLKEPAAWAVEMKQPKLEAQGDHIGPYKLLELIGEGGFGTVWVAEQDHPVRRRVALKILKPGMDTREVIARFEQERQALAMMDHPNIARIFDAGTTGYGRPYFVMELVRGIPITTYCDTHDLPTRERVELFIRVCQAVQHAHQKGIIHRDLKPSNILVTINDGEVVPKVIDFGVAKATQGRLTEETIYTLFEQMIGTPLYMSPEQAWMTSLDIDTRSDVYSLGVLLYELLTGRTPIDRESLARVGLDEVRRVIREVDPPRPSLRVKSLPGEDLTTTAKRRHTEPGRLTVLLRGDLDWIVMKCLEKDRKRRYDTVNGLALDLRRHLDNELIAARPPTTGYLLGKLIKRNKISFVASMAVSASLILGTGVSLWQATRAAAVLEELRGAAPAFADQARGLVEQSKFDEAIQKLDYAAALRPDDVKYPLEKARLLRCRFRLAEAAALFRQIAAAHPRTPGVTEGAALCEELVAEVRKNSGELSRESLVKLRDALAAELIPLRGYRSKW